MAPNENRTTTETTIHIDKELNSLYPYCVYPRQVGFTMTHPLSLERRTFDRGPETFSRRRVLSITTWDGRELMAVDNGD